MRDEAGYPITNLPPMGAQGSPRQLFDYRMFVLGIRDPEDVERLWQEAEAKRAADPKRGKKRRR